MMTAMVPVDAIAKVTHEIEEVMALMELREMGHFNKNKSNQPF